MTSVVAWVAISLPGCARKTPEVAPPEPTVVPISKPLTREVTDFVDFTGRTDAAQSVDVRPRVTGYLMRMPFKEGAEVKKGDLLFEIDPRPYEAQLAQAEGQVGLSKAQMNLAQRTYDRDLKLANSKAISQQDLDQDKAAAEEADARTRAAEASLEIYKLNLAFTKVTSPIDGLVSRYYLTVGNLVNQDQTLLTTVIAPDPMYVYFEIDEVTLLRIRRAINEGKIRLPQYGEVPVYMAIQGEEGYNYRGTISFVNNQVNPGTGSISVRGTFANPKPANGTRILSAGMFVRVRLPIGDPHQALLVIDRAIGSDQGLKYVFVVDADNKVQYRRVVVGARQEDGMRVIEDGLKATDNVVVGALPQIRPGMTVQTEMIAMPTLAPAVSTDSKQKTLEKNEPTR